MKILKQILGGFLISIPFLVWLCCDAASRGLPVMETLFAIALFLALGFVAIGLIALGLLIISTTVD